MFQSFSDSFVKWEPYCGELIVERFSNEEWKLMVSDICSDEEWKVFVNENSEWIRCYVLRTYSSNKEIGFIYIYNEYGNFDVVSIHGGGWEKSIVSTLFYYRGMILMLSQLLNKGLKVRTTVSTENLPALRFMRSLGFVPYRYTDTSVYLWINEKRLNGCKIYKHFKCLL